MAFLAMSCSPPNVRALGMPSGELISIYSDICVHAEEGDLIGDRVLVIFGEGDTYVVWQTAEGALGPPPVGSAILDGSAMRFTFDQAAGEAISFEGHLTSG